MANAFLDGFKMEDINPMFYTCLWEQFTVRRALNYTKEAFSEPENETRDQMLPNWRFYLFNITETVSNEGALAWNGCTQMTLNSYTWGIEFMAQFADSTQYYSYGTSVMQTVIGNVVYLT